MDLRQLIMLALQVSILSMVLEFGLNSTSKDLLYLVRRPGLLARSLLSVFVIMPALAVALSRMFDFERPVEITLIALSLSPVPPALPRRQITAGAHGSYGLGLMATLALASIAAIPALLAIFEFLAGRQFAMEASAITGVVMKAVIIPLVVGTIINATLPAFARRLKYVAMMIRKVLLPVAVVALFAATAGSIWALTEPGTVLAISIFTVAGLIVGHVLGGSDRDQATVLALSTACRHPAIALIIVTANFPGVQFGPLILLYLIVNVIVGLPYIAWQKHRSEQESAIPVTTARI